MKAGYRVLRTIFALIGLLVVLVVIGIVLVVHHNKDTIVISDSAMSPTLTSGQRVTFEPYKPNQSPARGDIVVFTETGVNSGTNKRTLVKRIIGVPGDRVTISTGKVTVFNSANPTGFAPDTQYFKTPPATATDIDITLQPSQYFVLGDNRSDSLDSRIFGPITIDQIAGKVKQ